MLDEIPADQQFMQKDQDSCKANNYWELKEKNLARKVSQEDWISVRAFD